MLSLSTPLGRRTLLRCTCVRICVCACARGVPCVQIGGHLVEVLRPKEPPGCCETSYQGGVFFDGKEVLPPGRLGKSTYRAGRAILVIGVLCGHSPPHHTHTPNTTHTTHITQPGCQTPHTPHTSHSQDGSVVGVGLVTTLPCHMPPPKRRNAWTSFIYDRSCLSCLKQDGVARVCARARSRSLLRQLFWWLHTHTRTHTPLQ